MIFNAVVNDYFAESLLESIVASECDNYQKWDNNPITRERVNLGFLDQIEITDFLNYIKEKKNKIK